MGDTVPSVEPGVLLCKEVVICVAPVKS